DLKTAIDSLLNEDHKYRVLDRKDEVVQATLTNISSKELQQKSVSVANNNLKSVKEIFQKYGFLGYDKVGKSHSDKFVYLLEYCSSEPEFQLSVLEKMKKEVDNKNANPLLYANLIDRVLIVLKRKQIYGTQLTLNYGETSYEPLPTEDITNLDTRRKSVGLPPIAETISRMNKKFYNPSQNY
ncbi:MAG: hypothetical protein MUF45_09655, partial [Spirosomaceae bacterium]|nr:hypothetical protein [Spirosomataceae bacterium]